MISIETTDIGDCQLMEWMQDKFDGKPRKMKDSQEKGFHPQDLFNIVVYPEAFQKENFFFIESLFGQYDPTSWNLKAVTRIKYHIANAVPNNYKQPESGLFNEDRVWTYIVDGVYGEYPYIVKMKFDGTTQYEGTEYHNFVNCYYGKYRPVADTDAWTVTEYPARPTILVREQQGKVFARIPQGYLLGGGASPGDEITYDPETGLSGEVQLYDFRCPVGESFKGVFCTGETMELRVKEDSQVEVGGDNLRRIKVESTADDYPAMEWDVVEDLGVVAGNGFFAFFNGAIITGGAAGSTMAGAGHGINLWKVTDTDGNLLYKARDYDFPDPGYGLFREDRVWTYNSAHCADPGGAYVIKMQFNGICRSDIPQVHQHLLLLHDGG